MTTNEETIKKALWVARDLSIKCDGEVPDVIRDAPAALADLVKQRDKYEKSAWDLDNNLLQSQEVIRLWQEKATELESELAQERERTVRVRTLMSRVEALEAELAQVRRESHEGWDLYRKAETELAQVKASFADGALKYDPQWAVQPKEES